MGPVLLGRTLIPAAAKLAHKPSPSWGTGGEVCRVPGFLVLVLSFRSQCQVLPLSSKGMGTQAPVVGPWLSAGVGLLLL